MVQGTLVAVVGTPLAACLCGHCIYGAARTGWGVAFPSLAAQRVDPVMGQDNIVVSDRSRRLAGVLRLTSELSNFPVIEIVTPQHWMLRLWQDTGQRGLRQIRPVFCLFSQVQNHMASMDHTGSTRHRRHLKATLPMSRHAALEEKKEWLREQQEIDRERKAKEKRKNRKGPRRRHDCRTPQSRGSRYESCISIHYY